MNNNDAIFEKARELGELIKASDVRQRSEEASKALLSDETAKGLIDSYNKLREDKMAEFTEKQPTHIKKELDRAELQRKRAEYYRDEGWKQSLIVQEGK